MSESNGLNVEARFKSVELMELRRQSHEVCLDLVQSSRQLRNYGVAAPLALDIIWMPEIANMQPGVRSVLLAGSLAVSGVIGGFFEKQRRQYLKDALHQAESAMGLAEKAEIPVPNWAVAELGAE